MVKLIFVFIFISITKLTYCQTIKSDSTICEMVFVLENWPVYEGGLEGLDHFLKTNLSYPESAINDSIEGIVFVSFVVEKDGSTTDHKLVKGIRTELDKEAVRVSKLIKFEKPAMQNGKPIKVSYTLPVEFNLTEDVKYNHK